MKITALLVMLAGCGGGGGSSSVGPPPPVAFTATLSANSATVYQGGSAGTVNIAVSRTSSTGSVTATLLNAPAGLSTTMTSPANGTSGAVQLAAGTAAAGTYGLTVHLTDGQSTVDLPLSAVVGVTASVSATVVGNFDEVMSTSFQIAEWSDASFTTSWPNAKQPLGGLQPQHIRMQPLSKAVPQTTATTWDFTLLDRQVQPILTVGDKSPEFQVATAPAFMYVPGTQTFADATYSTFAQYAAQLVAYYNTGGFNAPDGHHQSPNPAPIQWWGIYNEPNINGLSPTEYVNLYNAVVPAMLAADPTLKFMAIELADFSGEEQRYIPTFVQNVKAPVDVVATHYYSSCNQRDTDQQLMNTVPTFASGVKNIRSMMSANLALSKAPVWVTENNVNADFDKGNGQSACNPGQAFVVDQRGASAFFAAWRPYVFSQLGKAGNGALYHWSYFGDQQYGEWNVNTNKLQLSYWVDFWLAQYFPAVQSAQLARRLQESVTDANEIETLALKRSDGSVLVMVANHTVANATDNNGAGAARSVLVDLSAIGTFATGKMLTIDANTNAATGPQEQAFTPAAKVPVNLNGYGVVFLTLK